MNTLHKGDDDDDDNNPSTKDDLKAGTQVVVSSVSSAELYRAVNNVFIRCDIFLPDNENHSQHLL